MNAVGARQIKAARALLDWSQEDLAHASGLSIATIRKLELGFISPRHSTMSVLCRAIEGAGLEFMDADGVRRRSEEVLVFKGRDWRESFFNDMKETVRRRGGDIVIVGDSEGILARCCGEEDLRSLEDIAKEVSTVSIKCILTECSDPPLSTPRMQFRSISRNYVDPVPFCVYGDKYAIVVPTGNAEVRVVVIQSSKTADASRRQFYSMWDKTMSPVSGVTPQVVDARTRRRA